VTDLPLEPLLRAVRRRFGESAAVENASVPGLGGSSLTIVFDLVQGASRRRLVSRQETYVSETSPFLPPSQQFELMRVAWTQGVPVPEPLFEYDDSDGLGHGFVMAHVDGETLPRQILRDPALAEARAALPARLGRALARLHAIDPVKVSWLAARPDSVDAVAAQRDRLDSYAERHPPLEVGLRWLERNRPPSRRRSLVHGDLRNGNLIVSSAGLAAILDWECAHLGAPLEDLGWLCLRSWRYGQLDRPVGGFGLREDLYAAYEAESGVRVDPDEVRYWEVFGLARWAIINVMQAHGHVYGGRSSLRFAATGRNASMFEYDLLMTLAGRYA
jgi:aminoglycoside phosphotransferase (APT) family kinase protein